MKQGMVALVCLLGCSSQSTNGDGGPADASADAIEDATVDVQEAGVDGGCNALANVGTVVPQMYVATAPVTGEGGVIADGTYVLTATVEYTGVSGSTGATGTTFQDTVSIDGGTYERVSSVVDDAGNDGSPIRQNGSFVLNGSSIQITQTCPHGTQPFTSYDSNGSTFHVYAPPKALNYAVMFEYTKQ